MRTLKLMLRAFQYMHKYIINVFLNIIYSVSWLTVLHVFIPSLEKSKDLEKFSDTCKNSPTKGKNKAFLYILCYLGI